MKQYRATILSAMVLSCAMLGDTFLYPVLPTYYAEMHVPVFWIGFLLSINRYLRLVLTPWVTSLCGAFSLKRLSVAATFCAVASTLLYGFANHIGIWLIARTLWAFSFAILRISSIMYSMDSPRFGLNLGISRGVQEAGPLIVLIIGPLLLLSMPVSYVFFTLGAASMVAIVLAYGLPEIEIEKQNSQSFFRLIPSPFNFVIFISSFVIEGMLVVLIGTLLFKTAYSLAEVAALASFYLVFRKGAVLVVSPVAGVLANRYGITKVFIYSILVSTVASLTIALGIPILGILFAFIANGVTTALAPAGNIDKHTNRLQAVAANANWRDLGAACGTLIGGLFIGIQSINYLFFITTFAMGIALVIYTKGTKLHLNRTGSWK